MTLVVVDADVLGRRRTGDERYVQGLLGELPPLAAAAGLRIAAVTRHPELVPDGVEALPLTTSSQELRMAWTLPRLLRRHDARLVHTQYAIPLRCPCPAVVTIHDLSFERDPGLMSRKDRLVFKTVVPRAARRARAVLTVSDRTRRDLVALYGVTPDRVVVTPNGVDERFRPGDGTPGGYALAVGAVNARKNQLAALVAATEVGLPLVVAGPEQDAALAAELRARGATVTGWVDDDRLATLYREASCLVQASRFEGFGIPVIEAMASGTPVVCVDDPALVEVADGAAVIVPVAELAAGIRRALAERESLARAGLERAGRYTWRAAAERTVAVYREALGS